MGIVRIERLKQENWRVTLVLSRYRVLGAVLLCLGVAFLILGVVLPEYRTSQTFTASGPNVTFTSERNYWIDFYLIPPINEGQPIKLTLVSNKPGSTQICLGPFDLQTSLFSGPLVVNEMLGQDEAELVVSGRATKTGVYSLRITSWNSTYSVRVQSVWSPYHFNLRQVIVFAGAFTLGSLLLLYYDGVVEKRERISASQAYATCKLRTIPQDPSMKLGDLELKTKHAILGICEYTSRLGLVKVGPYMIVVGLGGTILWGVLWLLIPSVNDSIAGIIVPLTILICFVGGVALFILGVLASIAREW
jgi:hypothetical protein